MSQVETLQPPLCLGDITIIRKTKLVNLNLFVNFSCYMHAYLFQLALKQWFNKQSQNVMRLRPDFTSKLVHGLAFGTPKFYIAPYDNH